MCKAQNIPLRLKNLPCKSILEQIANRNEIPYADEICLSNLFKKTNRLCQSLFLRNVLLWVSSAGRRRNICPHQATTCLRPEATLQHSIFFGNPMAGVYRNIENLIFYITWLPCRCAQEARGNSTAPCRQALKGYHQTSLWILIFQNILRNVCFKDPPRCSGRCLFHKHLDICSKLCQIKYVFVHKPEKNIDFISCIR